MAKNNLNNEDFLELLKLCKTLGDNYPDGLIFIGGIAVYLHAINNKDTEELVELTHDADFYISIADMADLRDYEEVFPNRRLNKHQLKKSGFEFDIYTERHSSLIVPYDQVLTYSVMYDTLRVASLEHLTALKLEAYRDRQFSAKGNKDAKDLIRISLLATSPGVDYSSKVALGYLSEEHIKLVEKISRGPDFLSLALGNAKTAKNFRIRFEKFAKKLGS